MLTRHPAVVFVLVLTGAMGGCRSATEPAPAAAPWDVDRAQLVVWRADVPELDQQYALEASGLAASGRFLYVASEKYAHVLQVPLEAPERTRAVAIAVPAHSELEGLAWVSGALYLCDEAHAAIYEVPIPADEDLERVATSPLPAVQLPLVGSTIRGGKIGVEGIAVDPVSGRYWLLLERSGSAETGGCVSSIHPLRRDGATLVRDGAPIEIPLADCNWRLTGLELWHGELLGLKTQFPGERYEVVAVDPGSGAERRLLEMTELMRSVRREGWHNNVEGIAVTADGALWLVSDNDWTGTIDDPLPGPAREKTLLMRIPPRSTREIPHGG